MKQSLMFLPLSLCLIIPASCNKEMSDDLEDIDQFEMLAFDVTAETDKADVFFLCKDGSFILCDADLENGYGVINCGPNINEPQYVISILLNKNGTPRMASSQGLDLYFDKITDDGVNMALIDAAGNTIFAFDEIVPENIQAFPETKAEFSYWTNSWIDFLNSVTHWSWDDDQKKALGAFAWKVASFASTAFGTLMGNPLDIAEMIYPSYLRRIFEEIDETSNGTGNQIGYIGRGHLRSNLSKWSISPPIFNYAADYFHDLAVLEMVNLGNNEKQFSEYFELKDYHVKLKYGDEDIKGGRNVVNVHCGPDKGDYYVTVDTKAKWWFESHGTDETGDEWFVVNRIREDDCDKLVISVKENTLPRARSGYIFILTPGRNGAKDSQWYYGTINVEQGMKDDYLVFTPKSLAFLKEGGTQTVSIVKKSNDVYKWDVLSIHKWCTVEKKDDDCFSVSVEEYNEDRKDSWSIYLTATDKNNPYRSYYFSIPVIQETVEEDKELRAKLIRFYKDTMGENWINNDNWCSNKPISEWYGINYVSDPEGSIVINLPGNNLYGFVSITNCDSIRYLRLDDNDLSAINLEGCTNLYSLSFTNCKVSAALLSGCKELQWLYCSNNQLKSLYLDDSPNLKRINCSSNRISSLDINCPTTLMDLFCSNNNLKTIELKGYSSLRNLVVDGNDIELVDITNCDSLTSFNINSINHLQSFLAPGCTSLEHLNFYQENGTSPLSVIDLTNCFNLSSLLCAHTELSNLRIEGCHSLRQLNVWGNKLTQIDVSTCSSLEELECRGGGLKSIDVSNNSNLRRLDVQHNNLQSLSVAGHTSLEDVCFHHNAIDRIDIQGCSSLTHFTGSHTYISTIDFSHCDKIQYIDIIDTKIASLNLSGKKHLTTLFCFDGQIQSLNVSNCPSLEKLWIYNNPISSFLFDNCTSLSELCCENIQITREIPTWFKQLSVFSHNNKYNYYTDYEGEVWYTTNAYGWYYPGEPGKGYHGW